MAPEEDTPKDATKISVSQCSCWSHMQGRSLWLSLCYMRCATWVTWDIAEIISTVFHTWRFSVPWISLSSQFDQSNINSHVILDGFVVSLYQPECWHCWSTWVVKCPSKGGWGLQWIVSRFFENLSLTFMGKITHPNEEHDRGKATKVAQDFTVRLVCTEPHHVD